MRIACVCFDMDGTLVRNTNSVRYLCALNGELDAVEKIEDRERNGRLSWIEADHLKARLVENLELTNVAASFEHNIDVICNMSLVMNYLHNKQIRTVLITAGPVQVANILGEKLGFDEVYGTLYEIKGTRFTGRITCHLGASGKRETLQALCKNNGIALEDCVAIGDSESDIELFKICKRSIALNASLNVAELASVNMITEDAMDLLPVFERWLTE